LAKILVLHSGGLDSTVCLLLAKSRGHEVISLGIDYGQTHSIEMMYAAAQCAKFGVERRVIGVKWDKPARQIPLGRTVDEMRGQVSPAFLPARNGVFLMLACAEASGVGASEVWAGVNSIDFSGYPDCTPEFVSSFNSMIRVGFPSSPEIVAPLQQKSKPEIASMAQSFGIEIGDTWSCYRPKISNVGVVPCMQCDACRLHDYAWRPAA
jgi:7-cyano-7-deazaguanine synthase